jgi:DNA-binding response OmpR family regulator
MLLESEGYEVEVATDGEDARDKVEEFLPDLVISDVVMPRMSGFELCRHLKAQTKTASIPVVLLTALDSAQDLLRGLEAGADNFIRKPYDEDYLLSRVRRILSNLEGGSSLEEPDSPLQAALTGHKLDLTADKAQIVELLLSMVEDLSRTNEEDGPGANRSPHTRRKSIDHR